MAICATRSWACCAPEAVRCPSSIPRPSPRRNCCARRWTCCVRRSWSAAHEFAGGVVTGARPGAGTCRVVYGVPGHGHLAHGGGSRGARGARARPFPLGVDGGDAAAERAAGAGAAGRGAGGRDVLLPPPGAVPLPRGRGGAVGLAPPPPARARLERRVCLW